VTTRINEFTTDQIRISLGAAGRLGAAGGSAAARRWRGGCRRRNLGALQVFAPRRA
jgi:hypothetical protein